MIIVANSSEFVYFNPRCPWASCTPRHVNSHTLFSPLFLLIYFCMSVSQSPSPSLSLSFIVCGNRCGYTIPNSVQRINNEYLVVCVPASVVFQVALPYRPNEKHSGFFTNLSPQKVSFRAYKTSHFSNNFRSNMHAHYRILTWFLFKVFESHLSLSLIYYQCRKSFSA